MATSISSIYQGLKTHRTRVGGSGYTIFLWNNIPIPFAQQVSHTSPQPVGPGPVAIQPIDEPYPIQVITPAAAGMGSLTLNLYELYGQKVWDNLGNGEFEGAVDIVDLFITVASANREATVTKLIRPPKLHGTQRKSYAEIYHGAVITNVVDGEQIEVGTMEVLKQITIGYRYMTNTLPKTRHTGRGFAFRDGNINTPSLTAVDQG